MINSGAPRPVTGHTDTGGRIEHMAAALRDLRRDRRTWLLIAAMLLAGLNLRTAVTTVGPLLEELRADLGLSGFMTGLVTTVPVICFAVLGSAAPWLARRIGAHRAVTLGLVVMTIGLATRALAQTGWVFVLLSVLALTGGAVGNVLMPALVKRDFPDRIGAMTAAYTTALAIGLTLGAGLAVPIAGLGGGSDSPSGIDWRLGLGAWAVVAGIAVLPWLGLIGVHDDPDAATATRIGPSRLTRSPLAWAMVGFFAFQSAQAYIAFGWFAQFFREAGLSAATAGLLVAFLAALSIPVSAVVPGLMGRMRSQRSVILGLTVCYAAGYAGMAVAPRAGAWIWVFLVGLGSAAFPVSLTLIALRTRTAPATAALSAFTQSIGYVIAGTGPLLVGVLHGADGTWGRSFVLLFALVAVMFATGWYAAGDRFLEDQLAEPRVSGRDREDSASR